MAESLFQRFGALNLDADPSDFTETLAGLDPGRDVLIGLFKQAIESELGAAWDKVKPGTTLIGSSIIESTLPLEPSPQVVLQLKQGFPLLCVYRSGDATIEEHTLTFLRLTQPWRLDYVLGTLPVEDQRRLGDILQAVAKTVALTIERRGHPDYDGGALQFFEGKGRFGACWARGYQIGNARFAGGDDDSPTYFALSMRLETVEFSDFRDGFSAPFDGASFDVGVGGQNEIFPSLIRADTETESDL